MKKYIYLLGFVVFTSVMLTSASVHNYLGYKMMTDDYVLVLPDEPFDYENVLVPDQYESWGSMFGINNDRMDNITNKGATLGRVLFYDRKLSVNESIACASCHKQEHGFADNKQFSDGFDGQIGERNAINIADLGFTHYGQLLWEDSHADLAEMSLLPLENGIEMGIEMNALVARLQQTDYYPPLFEEAFGTPIVTAERIGMAMEQFMSSIAAVNTKLDQGMANEFANFTSQELEGLTIFRQHCQSCHTQIPTFNSFDEMMGSGDILIDAFGIFSNVFSGGAQNIGLDESYADQGMANFTGNSFDVGKFKIPNLKNVALSAPYMHDGRFESLEDVVNFYSEEVKEHENSTFVNNPFYDNLNEPGETFTGFDFDEDQKTALVAFLHTLTDHVVTNSEMWSDPFKLVSDVPVLSNNESDASVSPNPFRSATTIDLGDTNGEESTIKITQLDGKLVKSYTTNDPKYTLQRGNLSAGTYLLEIHSATKQSIHKIIVQ